MTITIEIAESQTTLRFKRTIPPLSKRNTRLLSQLPPTIMPAYGQFSLRDFRFHALVLLAG